MRRHRFFKRLPSAQTLKQNRFLKPFNRYLEDHTLWQFNRRAVAGGVAVGLFFGILVPFAQIVLAAVAAIFLRVNLPVAAFSTLITNPFTFPGVYYFAFLVGGWFTSPETAAPVTVIETGVQKTLVAQKQFLEGWFAPALEWIQTVGPQLLIGLSVMAVVSAVAGYFAVDAAWRFWVHKRWSKRRCRRQ
jgi:uncharacterized protein (DUF2062 family)